MIRFRPWYLQAVGAAFILTAGALALREIDLAAGFCLAAALAVLAAAVTRIPSAFKPAALTAFTVVGVFAPVMYFTAERGVPYLTAIAAFFAGGAVLFVTQHKLTRDPMARAALWVSLFGGSLALVWATYFQFLTPLDAFVARRLILTLFFVAVGLALLVAARGRRFWAAGGLAYVLVGVIKAMTYDATHLSGPLRIAVFAASGALLLAGAKLTQLPPSERDAQLTRSLIMSSLLLALVLSCGPDASGATLGAMSEHHGTVTWSFNLTNPEAHHFELDLLRRLDGVQVEVVGYTANGVAVPLTRSRGFGWVIVADWYLPPLTRLDVRMHVHFHPMPILQKVCATP